jgi:hypothetical protein
MNRLCAVSKINDSMRSKPYEMQNGEEEEDEEHGRV